MACLLSLFSLTPASQATPQMTGIAFRPSMFRLKRSTRLWEGMTVRVPDPVSVGTVQ